MSSQLGRQIGPTPRDGRAPGTSRDGTAPLVWRHVSRLIERTRPMSYETLPLNLAGEPVDFPLLANGSAIKNAARRFETSFALPTEAAFAIAACIVDPSEVGGQ